MPWLDALAADLFQPHETAPSLRFGHVFSNDLYNFTNGWVTKNEFLHWFDASFSAEARRHHTIEAFRPLAGVQIFEASVPFYRNYHFETYTDPPHSSASGSYEALTLGCQLVGHGPACRIMQWHLDSQPLYTVTPRELSTAEAAAWLEKWFQCLGAAGCPGLETFLAPILLKRDPAGAAGRDGHEVPAASTVLAAILRAERARWQSLTYTVEPLAAPSQPLPGARLAVRVRPSGVRPDGRSETLPAATWTFELIPAHSGGWQVFRLRW